MFVAEYIFRQRIRTNDISEAFQKTPALTLPKIYCSVVETTTKKSVLDAFD